MSCQDIETGKLIENVNPVLMHGKHRPLKPYRAYWWDYDSESWVLYRSADSIGELRVLVDELEGYAFDRYLSILVDVTEGGSITDAEREELGSSY